MTEKTNESTNKPAPAMAGVVLTCVGLWYYFGGGLEQQAEKSMARIEQQVAADVEREYQIAKRNGSAMDSYVHAGLVAAAYLQAEDEKNYQKWKAIESREAVRAGISR